VTASIGLRPSRSISGTSLLVLVHVCSVGWTSAQESRAPSLPYTHTHTHTHSSFTHKYTMQLTGPMAGAVPSLNVLGCDLKMLWLPNNDIRGELTAEFVAPLQHLMFISLDHNQLTKT
jgi:hypothetical protein